MMRNNSFPRWLAVAASLAIVAVLTGGAWFYRTQEEHLSQQAETELRSIAHLKAEQIAAWRHQRLADAYVLMESPFLVEQVARLMASPHAENTKDMLTRFRSLQKHYGYSDVLLVDADGQVRLRVGGSHAPLCTAVAQPLAEALRERRPVLTDIHAGTDELPPHISVIAPIFAKNGAADEQVGAIILLADAQQFLYPLLQSWPTPSRSAETLLVRRDGDSALFLNDLRFRKHTALRLRIPLSRKDVPAVMAVRGRVGVIRGNDYRGVNVFSAVQPIPDSPWFMVAKVDAEEVLAAWRTRSVLILAMTLALVLAAVAAAGLVWQRNDKAHYQSLAGAQEALRESEENLSITLRSIGDGVIATDTEGRITRMNPVAEELTGWPLEEAVGKPLAEVFVILDAHTREPAKDPIMEALKNGRAVSFSNDTVLIVRDGSERQIADSAAPIRDDSGAITGVVLVFSDVSEQYRTREALREAEEQYRVIFEGSAQGILIADGKTRQFIYANPSICRLLGYTEMELLQLGVADIHPKDSLRHVASEFESQIRGEKSLAPALPCLRKDGTVFYADVTASPLMLEGGRECIVGFFADITERKQAEEALRGSEERFRLAISATKDGLWEWNIQTNQELFSPRWCEIIGYSFDDPELPHTYNSWASRIHPDDHHRVISAMNNHLEKGTKYDVDYRHRHKSGEYRWQNSIGQAVLDESGKPVKMVGCISDITDRKQAEEALRESEENLSITLRSIGDGVIATDTEQRVTRMNPVAEMLTGWTLDEAASRPFAEVFRIINTKTRKPAKNPISEALKTGHVVDMANHIALIARDGVERQIADSTAPIRDSDGQIVGAVLVFHDVTQEYATREALRESEEKFRGLFDESRDGIAVADAETKRFVQINQAMCEMSGYTREEFERMEVTDIHPEESLPYVLEQFGKQVRGEIHLAIDIPVRRKDGSVLLTDVNAAPLSFGGRRCLMGIFRDITKQKQAEEALRESEEKFRSLFEGSRDAVMTLEPPTWQFTSCNQATVEMFGTKDVEQFTTLGPWEVSPELQPDGRPSADKAKEMIETAMREGSHFFEWMHMQVGGEEFPATVLLSRMEQGGKAFLQATVRDITVQKRAEEALQTEKDNLTAVFASSPVGMLLLDEELMLVDANAVVADMLLREPGEIIHQRGGGGLGCVHSLENEKGCGFSAACAECPLRKALLHILKSGTSVHGAEIQPTLVIGGQECRPWLRVSAEPVLLDGRKHVVVAIDDVTDRKLAEQALRDAKVEIEAVNRQLEEALLVSKEHASAVEAAKEEIEEKAVELSHQATHDSLTGLPNRECFERHLRERTASAAGQKRKAFDVMFMDLDKFKQINDTLGHNVGDLLLVAVADRLRSCLRSNDVLARMGGDEFTVIVQSAGRRSFTESVAARITDSISRPFEIGGRKFVMGVSFGLAAYPSDGTDSVTLLKHADAAMYKAKEAGRGTFRWFTGEAEAENRQRGDMERDLRCALEDNHLKVHYQPVVRLDDESLHGAEALLRWEHDKKGMISPSLFVPIAEEIGLIGSIGDYVLRTACSQTMAWRDDGIHLSQIGVNVSTVQIRDTSWLDSVRAAISISGLDPRHLVLELTETDLAADYGSLWASLKKVQQLGIGVAIDDFGMGQSSLSRVKDFAAIELKIDGSFVRDIEHNRDDKALLNSIIQMAHDQGIKVTAEWVETEAQADILRSSGCDFAQGFFFSPPLPADEFRAFALEQVPSAKRKRRAA